MVTTAKIALTVTLLTQAAIGIYNSPIVRHRGAQAPVQAITEQEIVEVEQEGE